MVIRTAPQQLARTLWAVVQPQFGWPTLFPATVAEVFPLRRHHAPSENRASFQPFHIVPIVPVSYRLRPRYLPQKEAIFTTRKKFSCRAVPDFFACDHRAKIKAHCT
jgi:hypothetical protein